MLCARPRGRKTRERRQQQQLLFSLLDRRENPLPRITRLPDDAESWTWRACPSARAEARVSGLRSWGQALGERRVLRDFDRESVRDGG